MSDPPRGPGETPRDTEPRRFDASPSDVARQLGELAGFGVTMGLATALFAWLGSRLDRRLGTTPLFTLVGAFTGFGAGFYSMYRRLVLQRKGADEGDSDADASPGS